jgi:hypothetical protein
MNIDRSPRPTHLFVWTNNPDRLMAWYYKAAFDNETYSEVLQVEFKIMIHFIKHPEYLVRPNLN